MKLIITAINLVFYMIIYYLIALVGYTIFTWQFWAILILIGLSNGLSQFRGRLE